MVTLGVVGAGQWGRNHVRVALDLLREGKLEGVVVCDADPARLKPWQKETKTTTSLADVEREADAAVLATPADTHVGIARRLLEAGVHALVEKPLTIRAADARELADLAERKDLVLMPGHIFRYHPAVRELRSRIERGFFGHIRFLSTIRMASSTPRPDVGVLYSLAIHEADLYPYLVGREYPEAAHAEVAWFNRKEIDEIASVVFRFPGACVGTALESWIAPPGVKERRLSVVGTEASALVDYQDTREMRVAGAAGIEERVPLDGREPLRAEVEDFLWAVQDGGQHPPVADAGSGVRAVEIVESLQKTGSFAAPRGT